MASSVGPDDSAKQHCPKCNAAEARTLLRMRPFVYLRCGACGFVWSIPDRRQGYRPDDALRRMLSDSEFE